MNHQILMRDAKVHEATISMRDAKLKQVDDDDDATTQHLLFLMISAFGC